MRVLMHHVRYNVTGNNAIDLHKITNVINSKEFKEKLGIKFLKRIYISKENDNEYYCVDFRGTAKNHSDINRYIRDNDPNWKTVLSV